MKILLLYFASVTAIAIGLSACTAQPKTYARSIYMLLDTSKETLKSPQKISDTLAHVINDLSPGDSIALETAEALWSVDFSEDASKAYVQKRDFRRKVMQLIKGIKPKSSHTELPAIAKVKAYLDQKEETKKTIIYFTKPSNIALQTQDLAGYTISMFNLSPQKETFQTLKGDVEMANGNFVVASTTHDLNQVLSYK